MISEAMIKEWKCRASKAGKNSRGESYRDEYEYHLGMVQNPLPFLLWKRKFDKLVKIQTAQDYLDNDSTVEQETELCNQLGY